MTTLARTDWWRAHEREPSAGPVAFTAFVGFTCILFLAPQTIFPELAKLHIAAVAVGLAVVALLAGRLGQGVPLLQLPAGSGPALILALWAIGTAPFSYWPRGSIELFVDLFAKSLIVFWLIPQVVDRPDRMRRIVGWLALLALPLAAGAIRNFVTGKFMAGSSLAVERIAGFDAPLTGNPNDLALTLNLLLPLTYALRTVTRRRLTRAGLALLMVLEVVGILLTWSRAGVIVLAVVWIGHALRSLQGGQRATLAVAVAAAVLGLALLPSGYFSHLSTVLDISADSTGSAQARWGEVSSALGVVATHPLVGVGLGMNILAVTSETGGWRAVHNVYLQYAADLGLPGLILFVTLLWRCLRDVRLVRRASRARLGDEARDLPRLATGIELAMWAFAVAALFHPAGYHFYFFYLGGLALAARSIQLKVAR